MKAKFTIYCWMLPEYSLSIDDSEFSEDFLRQLVQSYVRAFWHDRDLSPLQSEGAMIVESELYSEQAMLPVRGESWDVWIDADTGVARHSSPASPLDFSR